MKNTNIYLLLIPVLILCSCEKDIQVYDMPGNDRLNFVLAQDRDTMISHTFIYYPESREYDTLWIDFETLGYVTDYPRAISLAQTYTGQDAAVAGKHYIAFDDASLKDAYVIPAHKSRTRIPLIVRRDPTLKEKEYILRMDIQENEYFKNGYTDSQTRIFRISDRITRPKNWTGYISIYCFGKYGEEKYKFMIKVANERGFTIDENFFLKLAVQNLAPDMAYCYYWEGLFRDALEKENAEREKQGLGPIREEPKPGEEIGEAIYFKSWFDMKDFNN